MIVDSFTPSAIPFPSNTGATPTKSLYDNANNSPGLAPVKEAIVPVPTGGGRRTTALGNDPIKLGALVTSVALLCGVGLLVKRRSPSRPISVHREKLHVIGG